MTDVNDLTSVTWQAGWLRWMDAIRGMSSMIVVLFQISLLAAKNPSKWMGRLEWHSDAILTFLGKAFTEEVMIFICSGCKRNLTSQNWPQNKQHCLLSQWSNTFWGRQAPPPPITNVIKLQEPPPSPPIQYFVIHECFKNLIFQISSDCWPYINGFPGFKNQLGQHLIGLALRVWHMQSLGKEGEGIANVSAWPSCCQLLGKTKPCCGSQLWSLIFCISEYWHKLLYGSKWSLDLRLEWSKWQ